MHDDMPPLPDFLNRKLNPELEPRELPKQRKPRTKKVNGEKIRLYLMGKRGLCDGFHECEFVKRDKVRVTVRVGRKTCTVPCEQWDRRYAAFHGQEYKPV